MNQGFDDDGWGDEWDFDDLDQPLRNQPAAHAAPAHTAPAHVAPSDPVYSTGIDIDSKQYQNENLNKLNDKELAVRKRQMDRDFDRNFIKPGDPSFQYDKRIEFKVRKSGGGSWDGSSEEQYSDAWDE